MSEHNLSETSVGLPQDEYRRLCMRAFENLPTDTTVTMDDVDAILTWCLPEYDREKSSPDEVTEVGFVIQKRNLDDHPDWTNEGDESPTAEALRARLDELRLLWGHLDDYRIVEVKRKALDW